MTAASTTIFTPLSKLFGVASNEPPGVIIVGESEFSIHLGVSLRDHGIPVMFKKLRRLINS